MILLVFLLLNSILSFNNAQKLDNYFDSQNHYSDSIPIHFGSYTKNLSINFTIEIAGPTYVLDNATYPFSDLKLQIATGSQLEDLHSIPNAGFDFICDDYFAIHEGTLKWVCDFDQDSCIETQESKNITFNSTIRFDFQNSTYEIISNSSLIPFPLQLLEKMENSSGSDILNITVNGNANITYLMNDRSPACFDDFVTYNKSIPYSLNSSFKVFGRRKFYFTSSPLLSEQWFRNNRFDVITLSSSPLLNYEFFVDENSIKNTTIIELENFTNKFGLFELRSKNLTSFFNNLTTPIPLEKENISFSYIYQFNNSFQGISNHNLSLKVLDPFENEEIYTFDSNSRMLSINNIDENQSIHNISTSRSGAIFINEKLEISKPFGILLVLLLIGFIIHLRI